MHSSALHSDAAPPAQTGSLAHRPLLTRADVLFCVLPVALFLSIVSLV